MSTEKSAATLAAEYNDAYKSVKPFADALEKRIAAVVKTIKEFHRVNGWYGADEKFGWVEQLNYVNIDAGYIVDSGVWLNYTDMRGYAEEALLSFEDMDNIETILEANYAVYAKENAKSKSEWKLSERQRLEAKLAALDD